MLDSVLKLLAFRNRHDLVRLLRRARMEFDISDTYGSHFYSRLTKAEIYSPVEDCDCLRRLPSQDKRVILETLLEIHPPKDHEMEIVDVEFFVDPSVPVLRAMTDDELVREIEAERNQLITVATGGPRIQAVNHEYRDRRQRIGDALQHRGLSDPNPYDDLWAWHGKWSSGDLPTYRSRRDYVTQLYSPLLQRIETAAQTRSATMFEEPTGWAKVDRGLTELRKRLEEATTEEQFQAVGLFCRESLISLAQTVFDPMRHQSIDGVDPSATDAKRMLEAYLAAELAGGANEVARRHARAALELANELQHRRTATFRQAALCAEATSAVVNLVAIISGQRDP